MKMAGAYRRKSQFLIHSNSRLTSGAWLETEPFTVIPFTVAPEALGQLIRAAISASLEDVPHPSDWSKVPERTLEMAGVKSWNAFMKGSQSCNVEQIDGMLRFIPTENCGRDGFVPRRDMEFEISVAATHEEIGAALLSAFVLSL